MKDKLYFCYAKSWIGFLFRFTKGGSILTEFNNHHVSTIFVDLRSSAQTCNSICYHVKKTHSEYSKLCVKRRIKSWKSVVLKFQGWDFPVCSSMKLIKKRFHQYFNNQQVLLLIVSSPSKLMLLKLLNLLQWNKMSLKVLENKVWK